jgi:1-acyl-sn-glycerol-3-phosphate acyltransferase
VPRRKLGFWLRVAVLILRPPVMVLTKRDWRGAEHLPLGGAVVVVNHISYFDPLAFAHFIYDGGRSPRFLAKDTLFRIFFVGRVLRGAEQIPVYRLSRDASASFRGAIALETGCPVIPVAQWGAQELLPPYAKRPHLFPRKTMRLIAGPPVDLSEYQGKEPTGELLRAATAKIMDTITGLLEELRGEQAPPERFDMRKHHVPQTGNPAKRGRRPGTGPGLEVESE